MAAVKALTTCVTRWFNARCAWVVGVEWGAHGVVARPLGRWCHGLYSKRCDPERKAAYAIHDNDGCALPPPRLPPPPSPPPVDEALHAFADPNLR